MALLRASLVVFALLFSIFSASLVVGSSTSAPPSSDGTSIDQGIAYFLMLVALILTYLIHPLDASPFLF
ncbi:hypothetical protein QN277_023803 [Acacia crassicarpa]|uniref:Uncharacterized protein n=1 Tax=Acacia crassicarpa TaxID=499986 RepID=A0AAE1JAV9_9FABA|nr:hypothetical protein QN277_023803 [Acacia crassicarpa]